MKRIFESTLAAVCTLVSALALPAGAFASDCPAFAGFAGLYAQNDTVTGTGGLVRLEFVGSSCTLVASLFNPEGTFQVYAGHDYFGLPEMLGVRIATVKRATNPYTVLREPVASLGVPSLFDGATCTIQLGGFPGGELTYNCSGRTGTLEPLRS